MRRVTATDEHPRPHTGFASHPLDSADGQRRQRMCLPAELQWVVITELEAVSSRADRRGADAVEVAKSYRWLGDDLFDLGRGSDRTLLARGERAYERAEALLATEASPVEQAKTAFNYANTLRGLSEGSDVALLEAAETRYEAALAVFRVNRLPQLASAVEDQLDSLRAQLRLAREAARLGRGLERLQGLRARVATGDPLKRERIGAELATLVEDVLTSEPAERRGRPIGPPGEEANGRGQHERKP